MKQSDEQESNGAIETLVRNAKSAGETVIAIPQESPQKVVDSGGRGVLKAIR